MNVIEAAGLAGDSNTFHPHCAAACGCERPIGRTTTVACVHQPAD
jgi:hypothetical protein